MAAGIFYQRILFILIQSFLPIKLSTPGHPGMITGQVLPKWRLKRELPISNPFLLPKEAYYFYRGYCFLCYSRMLAGNWHFSWITYRAAMYFHVPIILNSETLAYLSL